MNLVDAAIVGIVILAILAGRARGAAAGVRPGSFELEDLVEVRAPEGAPPTRFELATPEWARRWPTEEVWKARKRG